MFTRRHGARIALEYAREERRVVSHEVDTLRTNSPFAPDAVESNVVDYVLHLQIGELSLYSLGYVCRRNNCIDINRSSGCSRELAENVAINKHVFRLCL